MARPRRLRHKLMLGLTLVVGSVGLLLGGTLYGITSYMSTVRTTERKLTELQFFTVVIEELKAADRADPQDVSADFKNFSFQIDRTLKYLPGYRFENAETVRQGLDPDDGKQERDLIDVLEKTLQDLSQELQKAGGAQVGQYDLPSIRNNPAVRNHYDRARLIADNVRFALIDDIRSSADRSSKAIRQSLWLVGAAVVSALVLVFALLYYFKRWIFTPITVLQGGVQRVHRGDFDHPIHLPSGDELEELATAFNAMTARVGATHADLARQVNERSRQLVRSERMVSVGFLAAGVAHEINNPLASIAFCAEGLERRLQDLLAGAMGRYAPGDAEVLTKYLTMIQQEAFRCKEITTKLLDFSRSGERKRESTDLAGLVRSVLEIARHLPNYRGKAIDFNPDGYVVAPVNAQDLKSVILNLVVNSLDSLEDGGTLTIGLTTRDGIAELTFADNGCGMPAEVLENIFEPFFTRSRTGKGTGLGLFISHQIIDQHGGTIQAASRGPGQGSTFTVRIPLELKPGEKEAGKPGDRDGETGQVILAFPNGRVAA